jgi:Type II CAAX prenyl endopeptidase Rce1-like
MNILITLEVAAFALCVLWAVQSVMLKLVGEPFAWPLQYTTPKPVMRVTGQAMIQVSWLIILVGTPLALGIRPLDALHQAFPLPIPWNQIAIAFSIMFFPTCLGCALYINAGWLQIAPRFDRATRRAKLLRRFLTPLPLATLEEAVFRGTLLEQLLRSLPQSYASSALAIVLSSLAFSLVHFIKPPRGKPVGQGIYGFFIAGCLFGVAYVVSGRSLWVPIVLHATAIFLIEVTRLYAVYNAPRWLAGFPEAPHSGLLGSIAVLGMAIAVVALI